MTPEEKPFDTSRIPVFYQDGSVKVGDKEYAPGEYPLGTDTMNDVDEVRIDTSSKAIAGHLDRFENDPQAAHHWVVNRVLFAALSSRCAELERLAGTAERYQASARSYFEKYAAGRMSSYELQPFREQFLDADKSLTEALAAYQRKNKGEDNG